jgi:hypothetical protein
MPLAGSAVLAIWNGIAAEAEEDFLAWHVREHIPERVGLSGFLRGRRYVASEGHPKYFNFYETRTPNDLVSDAYLARLDAPTPWTRKLVAKFTETSRTICKVAISDGIGDGAAIETVRLATKLGPEPFVRSMHERRACKVLSASGIVGFHVLEGQAASSSRATAEKRLRATADEIVDWILLIEAVDEAALTALRSSAASSTALIGAGAEPAMRRGIYRLQYSLSAAQLDSPR